MFQKSKVLKLVLLEILIVLHEEISHISPKDISISAKYLKYETEDLHEDLNTRNLA